VPRVWADSYRESGRTRIASLGGLVSRVWADSCRESGLTRAASLGGLVSRVWAGSCRESGLTRAASLGGIVSRVWAGSYRESGRTRIASLGGLVPRVWADSCRESGRTRIASLGGLVPRVWADSCRESGRTRAASLGGIVPRVWAGSCRESGRVTDTHQLYGAAQGPEKKSGGSGKHAKRDVGWRKGVGVAEDALSPLAGQPLRGCLRSLLRNRYAVVSANSTLLVKPFARPKRVTRPLSRSAVRKDNDSAIGVCLVQAGLPAAA
jgi:hypothetical protein